MTRRARQIVQLQTEIHELADEAAAHDKQADQQADELRHDFEAREAALVAELDALRETLEEHEERLAALLDDEAQEAEEDAPRRKARRARNTKKDEDEVEADPRPRPEDHPSVRVHALMADVAARLQIASETSPDDTRSKTELGKARRKLMEADRAAAQKDYARAEELAQEAAEVIASIPRDKKSSNPR